MAEIFLILSTLPIYYCFSLPRNPKFSNFYDQLYVGNGYVGDGEIWWPSGPAVTPEEAFLEECDRADNGEDIIYCGVVRFSMFFKQSELHIFVNLNLRRILTAL